MKSINELQDRIEYLEKENQYLRSLLAAAGISWETKDSIANVDLYDSE